MAQTIKLKYEGKCSDCGTVLAVGTKAKWYGRGRVFGLDCHGSNSNNNKVNHFYSPTTGNSWSQRAGGRCEDAPCCGCCTS